MSRSLGVVDLGQSQLYQSSATEINSGLEKSLFALDLEVDRSKIYVFLMLKDKETPPAQKYSSPV